MCSLEPPADGTDLYESMMQRMGNPAVEMLLTVFSCGQTDIDRGLKFESKLSNFD